MRGPEKKKLTSARRCRLRVGGLLLLLATGLFGGLGDFAGGRIFLDDGFDDSDGDSLPHVTDSEATEGRIVGERLHAHWLRWRQLDHSGVAGLDRLGEVFHLLAGTTIHSG